MSAPNELTAQQKLDALQGGTSNAEEVQKIESGGHNAATCDAIGRVTTKRLPDGIEQQITWDERDRIAAVDTARQRIVYEYDQADHLTLAATFTRDSVEPESELKFSYDDKGRLTQETQNGIAIDYKYDMAGRCISRTTPTGETTFSFDLLGQFKELNSNGHVLNFIRDSRGLETERHYKPEEAQLDAFLMNLDNGNGLLHQYENGIVRTIGQNSYRYDTRGRTIEKKVRKNGFRTKAWRYKWDDFDRLIEAHTPDGAIWRYSYDAFGRRIQKECVKVGESGKQWTAYYFWQGATLIEEWNTHSGEENSPLAISRWHFEPGTFNPIAKETRRYEGESTTGQFYPIVADHLGTPKELFDTEGNCVWQAEHELWGRTAIAAKKADNYQPVVDCSLRLQNQWEDEETGLYYNLNRYYDPDSGQYLSNDPIGLEGGLRTHGYVRDPMQWVDPLGLAGCPPAERAANKGFPGIKTTKNGGSSFKKTDYLYKPKTGEKNVVNIKLQGGRRADFKEANRLAGLDETPEDYTWHHVDNFNPKTGRATLELVQTPTHKATVPHAGSVEQYEQYHVVDYK